MPTPRVAAIHDISGFGRCSMTIIMPALSVMGVQCCPLPTAYLSTHTGGFEGNTFLDLADQMERAAAHWRELGLRFDAVYTGFMGSCGQAALAADCIRTFKRQENLAVVDPVMGDHGRLYRTYTPEMCAAVADYTPEQVAERKMEKGDGSLTLRLRRTKDIAAELGARKGGRLLVGFALETHDEEAHAEAKLERKNFDFVVLNSLRDAGAGFRGDTNKVTFIDRTGREALPLLSKSETAARIVDKIESLSK